MRKNPETLLPLAAVVAVILLCLCLVPGATAPAPTLQLVIRNFATGKDTSTVITDGCTIPAGALPAQATIQANPIGGSIAKAEFFLDNLGAVQQWSTPYLVGNKASPLALGVGAHTLIYATAPSDSAGFSPMTVIHFTVSGVNATQAAQIAPAGIFGANYPTAADNPANDPVAHPQLVTAQTALGQKWVRMWLEYPNLVKAGDSYWSVCRNWRRLGFKVLLQYQGFQDSIPKYAMPPRATYLDAANRIAASGAVDAVSWGNEIDSTTGQVYYTGTLAQMSQMLADVCPVTHAAGIINIAPSFVHSESWLTTAKAAGLYAHVDAADGHFYNDSVTDLTEAQALASFSGANNLQCWVTEFGLNDSNLADHAAKMQTLLSGLAAINGTFLPWSQLPIGTASLPSPLTAAYTINQPEYGAWLAGMTRH